MRNVIDVFASRPLSGHWKSKLAVAAVLFVALAMGFYALWHGPGQAAYALDDLPNRLLEIKSIYMTGWMFQPDWMSSQDKGPAAKYPVKIFAQRPDCFWHTRYGFSGPDATHKNVRVQSGYAAGRGRELISVSYDNRTAVKMTVDALRNELLTEMFLQSELPQQWLSGHLRDFVKTGTETVNNVLCDVYEHSFDKAGSKKRLWLDPNNGLPVKTASFDVNKAGRETLTQLFDHVEVNVSASATGLSFDLPQGYQVTTSPQSTIARCLQPVCSGSNGDVAMGEWHYFNVDDKAVLLAWYCEAKSGSKAAAAIRPEFLLAGSRPAITRKLPRPMWMVTTGTGC